jgi:hypothetical protein
MEQFAMYLDNATLTILHQERLDEAAKIRLGREALEAQREIDKTFNPALAWVGHRMMVIGAKIAELSGEQKPSLN